MFALGLLFVHKLSHLKFKIHVVAHLSRQVQMRSWPLKWLGDDPLIG